MPLSSVEPVPLKVQLSPLHENVKAADGGASTGPLSNSAYNSRLGDPVPMPVSLLTLALLTTPAWTVAAEAVGSVARYSAATPATCGDAIDVPLMVLVAVSFVYQAEVMLEPGANKPTQVPKLENDDRASALVELPTVSACDTRAGDELQALALLLPAATA